MTEWVGTSLLPSNLNLKLWSIFSFLGLKIFTWRLSLFALNKFERFDKSLFTCFDNFSSDGLDCIMLVSSVHCKFLILIMRKKNTRDSLRFFVSLKAFSKLWLILSKNFLDLGIEFVYEKMIAYKIASSRKTEIFFFLH